MAITIVATVGAATANSFVTEVEMIAYMAARANASTWTTTTGSTLTDAENISLVEATRDLSALTWKGRRVDTTQILSVPRQFWRNPDSPTFDYYTTTLVPQRVKTATMELAFQYIKAGATDVAALPKDIEVKRKKVSELETEFWAPFQRTHGLKRFPRVWAEISPLVQGSGVTRSLVKG